MTKKKKAEPVKNEKKNSGLSYWDKAAGAADEVEAPEGDTIPDSHVKPKKTTQPAHRLRLVLTGRLCRAATNSKQTQIYIPEAFRERLEASASGAIGNVLLVLAERELNRLEKADKLIRVDMGDWGAANG